MSAKPRAPVLRTVKTPEALAALRSWLGGVEEETRERGEEYFANKQVQEVWADADHYFEAVVVGSEAYSVTLFLTRGKWNSKCSCEVRTDCKHAVAASLAWLAVLGLTSQSLGYLLISLSLSRLPAVLTSIILLAQPVMTVGLGIVLLAEAPSVTQLLGVVLVIGGIGVATIPFERVLASLRSEPA